MSYMPRVGFACKIDTSHPVETVKPCHTRTTTAAWMRRQTKRDAFIRLYDIVSHNVTSIQKLIRFTANNTPARALRLSSDILPLYTHPEFHHIYDNYMIQHTMREGLLKAGRMAREYNIRLSFHPGQFCCLASDRDDVIENSIREFEYHTMMANLINRGADMVILNKINVHLSGRGGAPKFKDVFFELSPESRDLITIENDEVGSGLEEVLEVSHLCPIVLDIHHHWVHSRGEYISPSDSRVKHVVSSWSRRGQPMMHYSYPRAFEVAQPDRDGFITWDDVEAQGLKPMKLRAHSDYFPNHTVNKWASSFIHHSDIMCESKGKDLAAKQLIQEMNNGS